MSPDFLAAKPVRNAKISSANIFFREKSSVNSPTVKKLTILSPQFSSLLCSMSNSELPEIEETGNKYTIPIVKIAAIRIKSKKVKDIVKMILPNFDCCSRDAIELETAKNTSGTTLTKSRFRKISPKGFIYSTILRRNNPDNASDCNSQK